MPRRMDPTIPDGIASEDHTEDDELAELAALLGEGSDYFVDPVPVSLFREGLSYLADLGCDVPFAVSVCA